MTWRRRLTWVVLVLTLAGTVAGCGAIAPLTAFIQPPRFEEAQGQPAEIQLFGPGPGRPAGGAGVRLWLEVTNPNRFGFTLHTLSATLQLEGRHAATGDFPLGLPLSAGQASVVPLDLTISFADLPGLRDAVTRALLNQPVRYGLDGTIGIDAGGLGRPTFGPMRLVGGELRAIRR